MIDPTTEGHIVRRFDSDLGALRLSLLEMGGLALRQVEAAVKSLVDSDDDIARGVVEREPRMDEYDVQLTEETVKVLAQRQPVAGDLRVVMAVGRAVRDLERVGDEARKIAVYGTEIRAAGARAPLRQFYRDVERMAALAVAMLRDAIRAFDELDVEAALEVRARDRALDEQFRHSMRHLVSLVIEDPRTVQHTINTVFVIKALERIGDHAKNLADGVVYLAGK